jgi:hypothetical protein
MGFVIRQYDWNQCGCLTLCNLLYRNIRDVCKQIRLNYGSLRLQTRFTLELLVKLSLTGCQRNSCKGSGADTRSQRDEQNWHRQLLFLRCKEGLTTVSVTRDLQMRAAWDSHAPIVERREARSPQGLSHLICQELAAGLQNQSSVVSCVRKQRTRNLSIEYRRPSV